MTEVKKQIEDILKKMSSDELKLTLELCKTLIGDDDEN